MTFEKIKRRNLPHWDMPGAAYFVTTCLEGSIPALGLLDIADYRRELAARPIPKDQSNEEAARERWNESYDHWIRDAGELERILLYIEGNPVKAGLVASPENYLYSSAHFRRSKGLELGEALVL